MRLLMVLSLLAVPLIANALDTSLCPQAFRASYESLIPISEKKIERLRLSDNTLAYPAARKAYEEVLVANPIDLRDLDFQLRATESGTCHYVGARHNRAEIFTRRGRDYVRLYMPFRDSKVYTVHEIADVKPHRLRIDYRPTTALSVKVDTAAYHIGWAYSLAIKL